MNKFKSILSDEVILAVYKSVGQIDPATYKWVSKQRVLVGQAIEQAVLAKLHEQKPAAWFIDDRRVCRKWVITAPATAKDWLEDEPDAIAPLYAHPAPAYSENQVPEGWQLVPKEMTNEMRSKYWDVDEKFQDGLATMPDDGYKALLMIAPKYKGAAND